VEEAAGEILVPEHFANLPFCKLAIWSIISPTRESLLSTVGLLALTSLDQQLLMLQILFTSLPNKLPY